MQKSWWMAISFLALIGVIAGAGTYWYREVYSNPFRTQEPWETVSAEMPTPVQVLDLDTDLPGGGGAGQNELPSREVRTNLPPQIDWEVSFTAQAPLAEWSLPWGEMCEEASALMAAAYLNGVAIGGPDEAVSKLLEIKKWEEETFGYYKDTTAAETVRLLKEYLGIESAALLPNPTPEEMRRLLADNKILIVPAAGRQLGNPYYTPPGPLYHMLIVRGYTKEGKFITNDPGTRRGEGYEYEEEVLMNAIHDWNGGEVEQGGRVIIVAAKVP